MTVEEKSEVCGTSQRKKFSKRGRTEGRDSRDKQREVKE